MVFCQNTSEDKLGYKATLGKQVAAFAFVSVGCGSGF